MSKTEKQKTGFFTFERIEPMFAGGGRDWSVDVLRCLSCFFVCAIHATNLSYTEGIVTPGANPWLHHEVYRMAFASPTVLFVMVSGIFFLSPERTVTIAKTWRKNVMKMAFAYIFWSLIYALYRIYTMDPQPEVTTHFVIEQWIVQPTHLWYIPMIIGLYILSPMLRPITATYDRRLFVYIVAIFIMGMILWTVYNWPSNAEPFLDEASRTQKQVIIAYTPMIILCQYPMWMIFGWIAYTYRPSRGLRYIIYFLGIAALAAGIYFDIKIGVTDEDYHITAITQKFSIFSFFKNVALFYFVVTVFRNHRFSRVGKFILKNLSNNTLIIYLVHCMVLFILYDNNFLYSEGLSPWWGVWVYAGTTYLISWMVAIVFHLFWDPIKKLLFTRKKRSERIYDKIEKKDK